MHGKTASKASFQLRAKHIIQLDEQFQKTVTFLGCSILVLVDHEQTLRNQRLQILLQLCIIQVVFAGGVMSVLQLCLRAKLRSGGG